MPLTPFQSTVALLLSRNRTLDSHLAGGAALHLEPESLRYSNDLDYFNDSEERVAEAFSSDRSTLEAAGYEVETVMTQPGFVRAVVSQIDDATKVEWAHDTAWRFMPAIKNSKVGYMLHPVDLAVNKVLAVAGRDEPRDFLDLLHVHEQTLPIGALCWAAAGKDPGFTPTSLLALLRRRGRYRQEDFQRLRLTEPVDLIGLKQTWLRALEEAEAITNARPPEEVGCLYYSTREKEFVVGPEAGTGAEVVPHFGRPGGVLPSVT